MGPRGDANGNVPMHWDCDLQAGQLEAARVRALQLAIYGHAPGTPGRAAAVAAVSSGFGGTRDDLAVVVLALSGRPAATFPV